MGWSSKMAKIFAVIIGLITVIAIGAFVAEVSDGGLGQQRNCVGSVFQGKMPSCNVDPRDCMVTLLNNRLSDGPVRWDGSSFVPC